MKPTVKAFANDDDALLVWRFHQRIPDCYGVAIFRRREGETALAAEPIKSYVGFEDQSPAEGEFRPSTEWPIQKFVWTDYFVRTGDVVSYKVVPMIWNGDRLVKDEANASDWSNAITIQTGNTFKASFNRGIISSQFLAHRLSDIPPRDRSEKLDQLLNDPASKIRSFLGGNLAHTIYRLLDSVANDPTLVIYAALYELNEPVLIQKLKRLRKRANVILANGAFKDTDPDPNQEVRAELKDVINLFDRKVTGVHFAHNKFVVVCRKVDATETPIRVLTGSTNWTKNGMFAQVNNGLIIEDETVAQHYLNEWQAIRQAGNGYPPQFKKAHATAKEHAALGMKTWFTPLIGYLDMQEARELIANAKKGILFLMFKPGTKNTLFNAILDKNRQDPDLFVHGVINQDPGSRQDPLVFINRGQPEPTDFNAILPSGLSIGNRFSRKEIPGKMVRIHSKVILIDPFSDNPVLLTGSHNMGEKASRENDDNLNIIVGDPKLAEEYAVHIMSVYNHYRYRYFQSLNLTQTGWNGLKKTDTWQDGYFTGLKKREIDFWL